MSRSKLLATCLGFALSCSLATEVAAQDGRRERAVRLIPIHELFLRPPIADRDLGRWWQLDTSYEADDAWPRQQVRERLEGTFGPMSSSDIVDVTQEILSRSGRDVDVEVEIVRGKLQVAGSTGDVAAFHQVVEVLRSEVAPTIDIEVSLIRPPADIAVTTRIGAELWQILEQRGETLWSTSSRLVPGWPILLENARRVPYVADYDVEVAQEARIADPRIRHLIDGVQLLLDVCRLPDRDDLLVFGDLRVADLRSPVGTRRIGASAHGSHDIPELQETRCLFSGVVDTESRLAVWSLGANEFGEPFVLTVKAKRTDVARAAPGQFAVFPIEGLRATYGFAESVPDPLPDLFYEELEFPSILAEQSEFGDFYNLLGDDLADQTIDNGGCLFATAGPAGNRQIVQLLGLLADDLADVVEVDFAMEGHRIVMPCLSGRELLVTRGLHRNEITEYDVEIAGESQVANPVTRRTFGGVHLKIRPGPLLGEQRLLRVEGESIELGKPAVRPLGADDLGPLYVYSPTRSNLPWFGKTEPGKVVELSGGAATVRLR